jgi:nicotinate phosphoribosyltransferase
MSESLSVDLYELTMAQVYFKYKPQTQATFDLFIRSQARPFYVACGIDEALNYLENFKFSRSDIEYLKSLGMFDEDFLKYLENVKFEGTVWAVEEPEIIFAQEPILRVTANLIQAQIIESYILNKINLATTLATKAARVVLAAKGKGVYDFSLRRTQGIEASLACAKYSHIVGVLGTSNVLAGYLYRIPVVGTMAHSYVMSFEREIDSFLDFAKEFPTKAILLLDTYDVKQGIESAIRVARFLKKRGIERIGVRLDSGDLAGDARYVRVLLDKEGLIDAIIVASGNLDEYKIQRLLQARAPIDAFGVGTNMGCSSDHPYTDVIYKLVEIKERGTGFVPTMKLSEGKTTYPSRKQIFRVFGKDGKMEKDYLGLANEAIPGKKILRRAMERGRRVYREKTLEEKKKIYNYKISLLPAYLKNISSQESYPVLIGKQLLSLTKTLSYEIRNRIKERVVFLDIDTQIDFLDKKGALYVSGSEVILNNLRRLTDFAKKQGLLVISSQDTHKKDDPEFKEFPPHCIKGTKGQRKIKCTILGEYKIISIKKVYSESELLKITKKYRQIILEKNILNVFSNPNTLNLFELIFPDKVFIYGVVTEYCVKEAVEGLVKNDFRVVIVEDAIKEISKKEKERLFSYWKKKGVQFLKTQEVLSSF